MRYSYCLVLCFAASSALNASVIGTSKPAEPITAERIAQLPVGERTAWSAYLERSQQQLHADQAALLAEHKSGAAEPPIPKEGSAARSMPLNNPSSWYRSPEAVHIADVIISFQTPAGGWSKNLDMSGPTRLPGQNYASDNLNKNPSAGDFDTPRDFRWNYIGTIDNDATTTEIRFLALVSATATGHADSYRASAIKGIRYLLAAQFPNGGWPQVWPLQGGYHDTITYNDNALVQTVELLAAVSQGQQAYAFVPADLRREAAEATERALHCILATQIVANGKLTAWAQQYDALTLSPAAARNYEPAALSSGESASLLLYLMRLDHPSSQVISAVHAAAQWLKSTAIYGESWTGGRDTPGGRHLSATPGAGPLWSRYYAIDTGRSIFGDRDKTIHDDVADISLERRNGYQWYGNGPQKALEAYAVWSKSHPTPPTNSKRLDS
jgi:PelA/Pel-15E family pectate lyase